MGRNTGQAQIVELESKAYHDERKYAATQMVTSVNGKLASLDRIPVPGGPELDNCSNVCIAAVQCLEQETGCQMMMRYRKLVHMLSVKILSYPKPTLSVNHLSCIWC